MNEMTQREQHATKLAETVRDYWRKRGFPKIVTWVKSRQYRYGAKGDKVGIDFDVRSNMQNGLPLR